MKSTARSSLLFPLLNNRHRKSLGHLLSPHIDRRRHQRRKRRVLRSERERHTLIHVAEEVSRVRERLHPAPVKWVAAGVAAAVGGIQTEVLGAVSEGDRERVLPAERD